jgi:hypothetical protein
LAAANHLPVSNALLVEEAGSTGNTVRTGFFVFAKFLAAADCRNQGHEKRDNYQEHPFVDVIMNPAR